MYNRNKKKNWHSKNRFQKKAHLITNSQLRIQTRRRDTKAHARSTLLYGCETDCGQGGGNGDVVLRAKVEGLLDEEEE